VKYIKNSLFVLQPFLLKTVAFLIISCCSIVNISAQNLTQYVNPMIGTGGHGHTFPGAIVPFGMVQLSPDSRMDNSWDGCSGYHYSDSIIYGFSHTHLSGTGCSDYGDVLIMPCRNTTQLNNYQFASPFNHNSEMAAAGFYSVYLNKPKCKVQLTSTARCGMHQYEFTKGDSQFAVLDLVHRDEVLVSEIEIVYPNRIRGYRYSKAWAKDQKIFFEIEFSKPFKAVTFYDNDTICKHPYINSKNIRALFQFENNTNKLLVKVGISNVDNEGASRNLEKEMPDFDFEKYKIAARNNWQKELSKIIISTQDKNKKTIFYTALYHCMVHPSINNDVDYRYRGRDNKIHSTFGNFEYYNVFSLWDTYRALHPLLSIIDKKRTNDFVTTFIKQYEQGGRLPVWELSNNETNCMIGYHAASVIWDAYNKGIFNYDAQKALKAMVSIATENSDALNSYNKYGYVRTDDDAEGVSKTLEYAYNDWCIAQMAKRLTTKNTDTNLIFKNYCDSIYSTFIIRCSNWKNMYDPKTHFMRAQKNGTWYLPFSPYTVDNNYTEANAWQYSFYVPHDLGNLISIMGGLDTFKSQLNKLFLAKSHLEGRQQADITGLIGQYAHGNEPSHHINYLNGYAGNFDAQYKYNQKIIDEFYTNAPNGLIGNEDCGQMSAWYVLSSMGIYPICPGDGKYYTTLPQWDSTFVNTNDTKFCLYKSNITSLQNTKSTSYILQNELMNNNYIALYDARKTNINNDFNFSKKCNLLPNPVIAATPQIFKDSCLLAMQCANTDAHIFYTINTEAPRMYVTPFWIYKNCSLSFYSAVDSQISATQFASFNMLPNDRTIAIKSTYNKQYNAGGPMGLLDGLLGDVNWKKGYWQGYQSQDFEAVVNFNNAKKCKRITTHFVQDQGSWIFFPKKVSYYGSTDGTNFELIFTKNIEVPRAENNETMAVSFENNSNINYKAFKVTATNYGTLPTWHAGAGEDAFIFISEINIE
jgi:predicted alpha-1,2-mannosidase